MANTFTMRKPKRKPQVLNGWAEFHKDGRFVMDAAYGCGADTITVYSRRPDAIMRSIMGPVRRVIVRETPAKRRKA